MESSKTITETTLAATTSRLSSHNNNANNNKEQSDGISIRNANGRISDLKEINSKIFKGVNYSKAYYDDVTSEDAFSRLAFVSGELAGAICCFVVTTGKAGYRRKEVNVSTIGVLKQFRRKGVGSKLINEVVKTSISDPCVTRILLNVHVNDAIAIGFYKKLGFELVSEIKLPVGAAWVMELRLRTIVGSRKLDEVAALRFKI